MGWPQVTYIVLTALGFGLTLAKHGQPRDPYNFWHAIFGSGLMFGILYAGGFFA